MKRFRCWRPEEATEVEGDFVEAYDAEDAAATWVDKLHAASGGDLLRDDPFRVIVVAVKGDCDQVLRFEVKPEYEVTFHASEIVAATAGHAPRQSERES